MPKSRNVQLVESLYASFAMGNISAVLDGYSQQIEWLPAENTPYAATPPFRGKSAVLENVFEWLPTEWESFKVNPQEYLDAGDTVIVLGRYAGTHRKTGRKVDAQFAHLWDIRDGKVVRYRQYADTLQLAEAFGLATRTAASSSASR